VYLRSTSFCTLLVALFHKIAVSDLATPRHDLLKLKAFGNKLYLLMKMFPRFKCEEGSVKVKPVKVSVAYTGNLLHLRS